MKISKYMSTKLITANPDMSVKDAFLAMRNQRVRHMPVLEDGELVGFVSDRDLRRPQWVDATDDWTSYYKITDDTTVRDVMTTNPEVVHTYDRIRKAVRILLEQRYGALPVLDKKGELRGIISAHDLLRALDELLSETKG